MPGEWGARLVLARGDRCSEEAKSVLQPSQSARGRSILGHRALRAAIFKPVQEVFLLEIMASVIGAPYQISDLETHSSFNFPRSS